MFELLKRDGRQAAFNVFALIGIIGSALAVVNWIFSVIKLPLAVDPPPIAQPLSV